MQLEAAGERAVLVLGNQGVGKNVAVDRYLSLCGAEREYSQLHRDSTASSLTATPTLEDGILRHEDAPLVRAALHGRVCVLDEADKAPTEVTVLLKALVADGVLPLPDGRILRVGDNVHADFRLVVLANRPAPLPRRRAVPRVRPRLRWSGGGQSRRRQRGRLARGRGAVAAPR